ncbi:MAG TPA: isochorismatase family cysteine hydrolase [Ramlibacter sp.]|nr:isochorismatase family cysteine hydrolase [Ramlibacter sp.]
MRSIYLVLDLQNDLVHPDGVQGARPLGAQVRARRVVENTVAAVRKAREAGIAVGFVRVGFSEGYPECPPNSPVFSGAPQAGLYQLGTWGTQLHEALEQRPGDVQVVKHRISPFYSTTLMAQLRALRIERIYCSGVSTQAVVQSTVREGHDRDFEMVVLDDCCCAWSEQEHANSIASISRLCRVTTVGEVAFSH